MSVILVNDFLFGMLGEKKVLWNYMLDSINILVPVDTKIIKDNNQYNNNLSFEENVANYIKNNYPDCKLIIQNGSFFNLIPINIKKIVLIQDNLRKMNIKSIIQETNFKNADIVVSNSNEVDKFYHERSCIQIPLGVDCDFFKIIPNEDNILKKSLFFPIYCKIGIFVGSFTEVKGWSLMKKIIERHRDIFWILVTKHENESYSSNNSKVYNKIDQDLLVKLLNCSDFFILPSPSETQCLAAIEANLCNVPVIMYNTGYITNLTKEEKSQIGVVTNDFNEDDIIKVANTKFEPRKLILNKYSIESMNNKWIDLIDSCL
jgi:glycosyltransferase involved in cell wall biosynthesis